VNSQHIKHGSIPALATVLICVVFFGWLQFSFGALFDSDSYFHTRVTQQLVQHGIRKEFQQTAFSTWAESYSDKDLLFHVLLAPFCGREGDLIFRAKLAVVFLDFLFLLGFAGAVTVLKVRLRPLWILLLLLAQPFICIHLFSVRPHVLGSILLLVESVLLMKGKWKALFFVTCIHVLAHSSFVLVPALLLAQFAAHLLRREALPLKSAASVGVALIVSSLLHPYFPNNLSMTYDQIVGVAWSAWGGGGEIPRDLMGPELLPMDTRAFLSLLPGLVPAVAGLIVFPWRGRRDRFPAELLTLAFICLGFFLLTFLSLRFAPILILFGTLFAARLWSEFSGGWSPRSLTAGGFLRSWIVILVVAVCVIKAQADYPVLHFRTLLRDNTDERLFRPAVQFLDQVADREDIVYHTSWRDFSVLYHYRPQGRYIYALDPIFLHRYDRKLFEKALEAYRGQTDDLHSTLAEDFGARWIYMPLIPWNAPFWEQVKQSDDLEVIYPGTHVKYSHAVIIRVN
jgi:hypothetical protein